MFQSLPEKIAKKRSPKRRINMTNENGNGKSLLIVDDQIAIIELMKPLFMSQGYEVIGVETGREAIAVVQEKTFTAVLLDLTLADMNGLEVLAELKKIRPELPVIIVTGHHDERQ